MLYEEFCEGVGMSVDRECYERIEAVYLAFDRFDTKQAIYDFYKKHDMCGIEILYAELHKFNTLNEQRRQLQCQIDDIAGELNKMAMLCGIQVA